jgi:hypothetical protein
MIPSTRTLAAEGDGHRRGDAARRRRRRERRIRRQAEPLRLAMGALRSWLEWGGAPSRLSGRCYHANRGKEISGNRERPCRYDSGKTGRRSRNAAKG